MKKLTIDDIYIELTRWCNMNPQCDHCVRGDMQPIRIKPEDIDSLLDQTEIIGTLLFTGGEPFMNVGAMDYFLDQLYERRIPLFELNIITNGMYCTDKIIDTIKRYSNMIKLCNEIGMEQKIDIEKKVIIGISIDKYHNHLDIVQRNFEEFKTKLKGYAQVVKVAHGNIPILEGRGKALKEGIICIERDKDKDKRIEILDNTHKPLCPNYNFYKMIKPDQTIICCCLYLSAKGFLMPKWIGIHDYDSVDDPNNHICHVSEPIYESIIKYNQGKIDCCTLKKRRLQKMKSGNYDEEDLISIKNGAYIFTQHILGYDDSDKIIYSEQASKAQKQMQHFMNKSTVDEINEIMVNATKHNYLNDSGAF